MNCKEPQNRNNYYEHFDIFENTEIVIKTGKHRAPSKLPSTKIAVQLLHSLYYLFICLCHLLRLLWVGVVDRLSQVCLQVMQRRYRAVCCDLLEVVPAHQVSAPPQQVLHRWPTQLRNSHHA